MLQRILLLAFFGLTFFFGSSQPGFSKNKVVKFTALRQPLGQVLETIQDQSGIRLVFVNSIVDSFKVFRKFDDSPSEAVRKSLLGTPLDFIRKSDDLWVIVPRTETVGLPAVLTGKITDIYLNQPIAGTNIYVFDSNLGVTSDRHGTFELSNIPPGRTSIHVSRIGYHSLELELTLRGNTRKSIEIALEPKPVPTPEVVVEEKALPRQNIPVLAAQTVSKLQMNTPPLANDGEIFELLHQQPGISRRDMDDVFPHIEGGSATEVAIELDGIPIYVPTFGQNRRSVFAASLIDHLTLHRAGFGVEYGDAMSGVIALQTPKINDIPYSIYTSASMTGLTFNFKKSTKKVGVTGAWRNGKFDNDLRLDQWQGLDLFTKLEYRPARKHKVTLLTLVSRGSFSESNSLISEQLVNQNLGLKYEYKSRESGQFTALGYSSKLNELQRETGFKVKYTTTPSKWLTAVAGLDFSDLESRGTVRLDSLDEYKVVRELTLPTDLSGNFYLPILSDPLDLFTQKATVLTPYLGLTADKRFWQISAGLRLPSNVAGDGLHFEPRARLTVKPTKRLNVALATGRYFQFTDRSYASEAKSGDHLGRGEFLIKTSAEQPSRADHIRAEATLQLTPSLTTSIAYFSKDYDFRDRAYMARINRWFWSIPLKTGESRGYEYWVGKTAGQLQGWISYTLNNQVYQSDEGTFFRPYFNRDKIFNLSLIYFLSSEVQIKGQYLRATGYPLRNWGPERIVISRENTPESFAAQFLGNDDRLGLTTQYAFGLTWYLQAFAKESKLSLVAIRSLGEDGDGLQGSFKFWASLTIAN